MYSIVYVFITAGIEATIETSVDGHLTLKSLLGLERECEFCSHLTYLQLEMIVHLSQKYMKIKAISSSIG